MLHNTQEYKPSTLSFSLHSQGKTSPNKNTYKVFWSSLPMKVHLFILVPLLTIHTTGIFLSPQPQWARVEIYRYIRSLPGSQASFPCHLICLFLSWCSTPSSGQLVLFSNSTPSHKFFYYQLLFLSSPHIRKGSDSTLLNNYVMNLKTDIFH